MTQATAEGSDWVFGYGSLMWRPGFRFETSRTGYITGFERRFWQASMDHRGTPGAPGRVVTLVANASAVCWGVAFRISSVHRSAVLATLDRRESGGYRREIVEVRFVDGSATPATTYRATPDNDNYLGPAALDEVTAQIRRAHGPRGANLEYVLKLAEILRGLRVHDDEVHLLEARLTQTR